MPDGHFNVVLTTNFDDLMADALYLFSPARPLVIHHESLAGYIRPTRTRPLVVKLHGDNCLSPQNTAEETNTLKEDIEKQIRPVLHDRGLIFIGYGGNDQGIANMLATVPKDGLPLGVFWISRTEPQGTIRPWLESRTAIWVEKGDFDELMLLVRDSFDVPHPDQARFHDVFEKYRTTYGTLSSRIVKLANSVADASAMKKAVKRADRSFRNAWAVLVNAERLKETKPDQANAIYSKGLEQFPGSAPLLGSYANFLSEVRKDHDGAEEYYRRALAADPDNPTNLGNYAVFLHNVRKDHDGAEENYRRALAADPNSPTILANYGLFLHAVRKDHDGAEEHFRRALAADPDNPTTLCYYALFLHAVRKDYDGAEEHYRRALAAHPNNPLNLENYATFLYHVRKDHDGAEKHFRRALAADPNRADSLGDYANFLYHAKKDYDAAEEHYRRALAADPNDADYLGCYANFLYRVKKDYDGAEKHYRRALVADPNHANDLGNYAGLLLARGKGPKGLTVLREVLSLPASAQTPELAAECWFYAFAHGPAKERAKALQNLKRVLEVGGRSPDWDLTLNIARARKDGHPDVVWLKKLAAVISDGADIKTLDAWPRWKKA
jgi:Tfp pilus assembly protein PilF